MGHSKVGSPWVDVGGLWTPVPTHDLNSDKSERKLLANGSSTADYVEVESKPHHEDDLPKNRLGEVTLKLLGGTLPGQDHTVLHHYSHPVLGLQLPSVRITATQ